MTGRSQLYKRTVKSSAGTSFGSLVRSETAAIYDKVLYVDVSRGSDAATGEDWDSPLLSINGAMAKLYGGDDSSTNFPGDARARSAFAVVYRSHLGGGYAPATQQIINVNGVHLIGAGQWFGAASQFESTFVVDGTKLTSYKKVNGTDIALTGLQSAYAGLIVAADSVVIDGIYFYGNSSTNSPYMVAVSDYETHSGSTNYWNSGRGCGVYNSVFQGNVNGTDTYYGLGLCGAENNVVANNRFRYVKEGVTLGGGPMRYANDNILDGNRFSGCAYGIRGYNAATVQNYVNDAIIQQTWNGVGKYGWALVTGIDWTSGTFNFNTNCFVNHGTVGNAYVAGTNNWFQHCWYGDTGYKPTEFGT